MFGTIWVTGASSGIGAAFVDAIPTADSRVIGVSRRPHPAAEHFAADLSDPAIWPAVEASFTDGMASGSGERVLFFHCAGVVDPAGPMGSLYPADYTRAVLLNAASGQVLGRSFLSAAQRAGVAATLVVCSSPSAHKSLPGMTHYCAGKAALEQWTRVAAAELGDDPGAPQIFSIVPYAVDTAMVRESMERTAEELPISEHFRKAAANEALATPKQVAAEIWSAIERGVGGGEAIPVGAVPEQVRG